MNENQSSQLGLQTELAGRTLVQILEKDSKTTIEIIDPESLLRKINSTANPLLIVDYDGTLSNKNPRFPDCHGFGSFAAILNPNFHRLNSRVSRFFHSAESDPVRVPDLQSSDLRKKLSPLELAQSWYALTGKILTELGYPDNTDSFDHLEIENQLKPGAVELLHSEYPILILSAGFADTIARVLHEKNIPTNKLILAGNAIHARSKIPTINYATVQDFERTDPNALLPVHGLVKQINTFLNGNKDDMLRAIVDQSDTLIIFGDNPNDMGMGEGYTDGKNAKHIIRVAILNEKNQSKKEKFIEMGADIIVNGDEDIYPFLNLLSMIQQKAA
jgi:hypothetical protein